MTSDTEAPRANGYRSLRRVRTDAQMAQKRLGDRQKQKTKRAESKMRMERIEKDIAYLRQRLEVATSPPTILQQGPNEDAGGQEASWPAQSVRNNLSVSTVVLA
jgi:transcription elongation GreA/GreB family factor